MATKESSLILNVQSDGITQASARLRELARSGDLVDRSLGGLQGSGRRTSGDLGRLGDAGRRAGGGLDDTDRAARRTRRSLDDTSSASSRLAGNLKGLIVGAVGIGAISAAAGAATREWLQYDKAIKEVNSITSQSAGEFRQMRKDVLNLSVALGVDTTQAAKGLYQALSSGIPKENAIAFLATASKAAIAGVTDIGTAVDGLTNTINAFKIPVSEAEDVADKLFSTVVQGKTTFEELSRNMSKASVPAAALGIGLDELLGVVVGITKQGTPTAEAFTQIKATIQALNDPSEELAAVYREMGVESGRAAIAQFGLVETLNRVESAYRGNDAALIKALRSSEAFNGVLSVTGRNLESTKTAVDGIATSSGQMDGAFKENANTLENSLNKIKATTIHLVETIESSFGILDAFSTKLSGIARGIAVITNDATSEKTLAALDGSGFTRSAAIQTRINELETSLVKIEQLKSEDKYKNAGSGLFDSNSGSKLVIDRAFKRKVQELDQLKKAYSEITPVVKETANSFTQLKEIQNSFDAGLITAERKLELERQTTSELLTKVDTYKILEEQESKSQKLIEDADNAQQERVKIAAKQLEEEKKAATEYNERLTKLAKELAATKGETAAEEKKASEDALARAKDLITTDKQRIQLSIDKLELDRQKDPANEATYSAAIVKLQEEIKLLEKRNSLKPGGSGSPKGLSSSAAFGGGSFQPQSFQPLPDLNDPFQSRNEFDELDKQVEQIRKSYLERKAVILSLTTETEDEKNRLIQQSQDKFAEIMAKAERERNTIRLNLAADFFGNLSQIASVFGAKGAKVAKAAAITQTIIKTYESATSAYASLAGIPYIGPALGAAAAGAAIAAGFANVQAIRSQPVDAGAYAMGGIVGGNNRSGDNMQARVNSGEMILNLGQQAKLFNIANGNDPSGNGQTSQPIINVNVQTLPGTTAEVKQNPNNPEQLEIIIRKVDEAMASNLQTGGGKFVPALTRRIPALKQAT